MSNLQVRFPVVIDFAKNTYVEVEVTKRSRNGYIMEFYFLNQGKAIPKEDIGVVSLKATTEGGAIVFNDILLAEGEYVEYKISETILAEIGRSTCVLQLMDAEGNLINSFEWYVNVKTSLYDENAYVQQDDITAVRSYVLRAESAADKSEEHEKYLREVHANLGDLEEKLGVVKEDMEDYLQEVEEKVENGAFTGATGIQGPQGPQGETGPQGPQGEPGPQGASGITAPIAGHYVLSVEGGYLYVEYDGDTEPNFELDDEGNLYYVVSGKHKVQIGKVKGEKGDKGDTGEKGEPGEQGSQGEVGPIGENGKDGKTAYEYAKDGGYTGSEEMFAESLANATELETYKANSILSKASGEVVTTTDSANVRPKNIKLFGKGKQRQYEGRNLFNFSSIEYLTVNASGDKRKGASFTTEGTYTISQNGALGGTLYAKAIATDGTFGNTLYANTKVTVTIASGETLLVYTEDISLDLLESAEVQVELSDTQTDFEPFVGNEPSPSINYPQKAEFLGESGSVESGLGAENYAISDSDYSTVTKGITITKYQGASKVRLQGVISEESYPLTREMNGKWQVANESAKLFPAGTTLYAFPNDIAFDIYDWHNERTCYFTGETTLENDLYIDEVFVRFESGYFPNGMIDETIEFILTDSLQPFTALTPNGLRSIPLGQTIPDAIKNSPIHMAGVYWDEVEQQYYIGDYKDYQSGNNVQIISDIVLDGGKSDASSWWETYGINDFHGFRRMEALPFSDNRRDGFCNQASVETPATGYVSQNGIWLGVYNDSVYLIFNSFFDETLEDYGLANFRAHLDENPLVITTWLDKPIITDLTREEIDQYNAIHMNYPNTTIVNDAGAYMEVEYVCDTKEHIKQNYTPNSVTQDLEQRLSNVESQIALNS